MSYGCGQDASEDEAKRDRCNREEGCGDVKLIETSREGVRRLILLLVVNVDSCPRRRELPDKRPRRDGRRRGEQLRENGKSNSNSSSL